MTLVIKKNISYRDGVSSTGACATLFSVEISNEMKLKKCGGIEEGEIIGSIEVPV